MADVEKVKEGLRVHSNPGNVGICPVCPYHKRSHCVETLCFDSLNLISELQAEIERLQPRWIPVSERLPEQEQIPFDCLVALRSGAVREATFLDVDPVHRWCTELHYFTTVDVIAWMPLPEPPQEG